jgi:hypothetical protein
MIGLLTTVFANGMLDVHPVAAALVAEASAATAASARIVFLMWPPLRE